MAVDAAWAKLHAERFAALPLDCGNDSDPGTVDIRDLRDWSRRPTTPDQLRIERYIDRYDLRDRDLLHIGIGNSGLARRFHRRVKSIVGTTIDQPEIEVAERLGFPNYRALRHNKFSGSTAVPSKTFDFIIDNNLASSCCCVRHLAGLLHVLDSSLSPGGQIVTDREGLEWIPPNANRQWSFDFDDLAAVAKAAGLNAYRVDANIYVLAHIPPASPGALPLLRHALRCIRMLPWTFAGLPRRILRRLFRSTPD